MSTSAAVPTELVPLYRLAHSRAGDKGDISCLSVIAYRPDLFAWIERTVTPERVAAWFGDRQPGSVRRYVLPRLHALNLVLDDVLDGGVNGALNLDTHGKTLSFHLLAMPVPLPADVAAGLPGFPG